LETTACVAIQAWTCYSVDSAVDMFSK